MHAIEHTYQGLLADVASLSGFSEIRGSYMGLQWCLNEAPKLDKHILGVIEGTRKLDLQLFPMSLRRLAAGSVEDPVLLRYLRQLVLFCYKAQHPHEQQTVQTAYEQFAHTNRAVGEFSNWLSQASPRLLNSARKHVQSVLYRGHWRGVIPSHGPGAVTTSKTKWQRRFSTIESLYPYSDMYCCYFNSDHVAELDDCTDGDIEAKLIAVPKDSRGPRLICVHPAEAIWLQQGLRVELERVISRVRRSKGPWPHGHIFFDDQTVNGKIALLSSKSRRYATIDMKEASDRISETLVQILFGDHYKYFGCCRAQKVRITSGPLKGQMDCASYAPMGNATTFPVQSLVFWAICVASLQLHGFHQPGAVFVFGDDIIVPSVMAPRVIEDLESFGLLVNKDKTFYRGFFRESCGIDAFKGVNVSPVRWKTTIDAEHVMDLQSLSDLGMRLRISGYSEGARCVYSILRCRLKSRYGKDLFLTNNPDHGGIAEFTNLHSYVWRDAYWHTDIQKFVSPVWRLKPLVVNTTEHGWNHVLESLCSLERNGRASDPDRDALRRLVLNRGWTDII